jgi:hypothetical protein
MLADWEIRPRGHKCARTSEPFTSGEPIYTLLFQESSSFRREDISEQAWRDLKGTVQPFSFWRSIYEQRDPPAPEPLSKESGESLLRRLIREDRADDVSARYVLALMLERKKILRQVDARTAEASRLLIYEHAKTGEVFIIVDPDLLLSDLESVQEKIFARLATG